MLSTLNKLTPVVNDFPKPGIKFRNISPLLRDVVARNYCINEMAKLMLTKQIDVVVGLDARGFIFGSLLASKLDLPFVMARKPSKLPGNTEKIVYDLEYASACLEIEKDAINPGTKVLIVDDILVSGGTILAAHHLITKMGATTSAVCCFAEIAGQGGVEKIRRVAGVDSVCLLQFDGDNVKEYGKLDLNDSKNTTDRQTDIPTNSQTDRQTDHQTDAKAEDTTKNTTKNNTNKITTLSQMKQFVQNYEATLLTMYKTPVQYTKKFQLLYHPSMQGLAKNITKFHSYMFDLREIKWEYFPDGFANIAFPNDLEGSRVVFLASLADKYSYMDQLSVMAVLPRQGIKSLHIMLPYYAPGTMERIEVPGTLATADTYAQITSKVFPPTKEGPPVIGIYDLHNSTTRHSFSNTVQFNPLSAIPLILCEFASMVYGLKEDQYAVAFPDEGSYKRFRGLIPKQFCMIVCGKVRDGEKRIVRIMDIIPSTVVLKNLKHVLIIDDLVQTGGTLNECRIALKAEGIPYVSAFCTHAVFPRREYLHFFKGGKWEGFTKFFITDSISERATLLNNHEPFRVISLSSDMITTLSPMLPTSIECFHRYVTVFSKNPHKIIAVKLAFQTLFPLYKIKVTDVDSKAKTPVQPVGLKETIDCANMRMLSTADHYSIVIENGIDIDRQVDFPVVIVRDNCKNKDYLIVGDEVKLDENVLKEWQSNKVGTCGDVYKKLYGYSTSNWHVNYGMSRIYIMKCAIEKAIRNF